MKSAKATGFRRPAIDEGGGKMGLHAHQRGPDTGPTRLEFGRSALPADADETDRGTSLLRLHAVTLSRPCIGGFALKHGMQADVAADDGKAAALPQLPSACICQSATWQPVLLAARQAQGDCGRGFSVSVFGCVCGCQAWQPQPPGRYTEQAQLIPGGLRPLHQDVQPDMPREAVHSGASWTPTSRRRETPCPWAARPSAASRSWWAPAP